MKEHHPPHFYFDESFYFLTSRIYNKQPILNTNQKKDILLRNISKEFINFNYKLFAWVILDNHYHIQFQTRLGKDLSRILNNIHGRTSFLINELDNIRNRRIFQNYWDHCVDDEGEFWRHFNYIHHNPIKHNYVRNQDEVLNYKFCSYWQWVNKKGKEWVDSCFENYPVVDFTVSGDD